MALAVDYSGGKRDAAVLEEARATSTGKAGNGGKRKRIAPTPVSRATGDALTSVTFGGTTESALRYARSLTEQQRRDALEHLQRDLADVQRAIDAISQVDAEGEGEDEGRDKKAKRA
jgi:hypothetical protein